MVEWRPRDLAISSVRHGTHELGGQIFSPFCHRMPLRPVGRWNLSLRRKRRRSYSKSYGRRSTPEFGRRAEGGLSGGVLHAHARAPYDSAACCTLHHAILLGGGAQNERCRRSLRRHALQLRCEGGEEGWVGQNLAQCACCEASARPRNRGVARARRPRTHACLSCCHTLIIR